MNAAELRRHCVSGCEREKDDRVSSNELNSRHRQDSPQFIPKRPMCHDVQIPRSENDNPIRLVSVTVSKLTEPKSGNGL